jgi:hypothetical protein
MKTKKRFSVGIAGLFLLFIMALWGCASPVDDITVDGTEQPYAIPGPGNVTARVYEGIVLLTWDPVPDAEGYQIFRKDNTDNITKAIAVDSGTYPIGGPFYFIDTASITNNLIDGHSYTYIVYSLSGHSANHRAVAVDAYIGNGASSSNEVTANVPDRKSTDDETFAWITVDQESVDIEQVSGNYLQVSWDAQPNLRYLVRYIYGKGLAGVETDLFPEIDYGYGNKGYSPLNPRASVQLPLLGSAPAAGNTVIIYALYIGDYDYYYEKYGTASQTESFAKTGVGTPQEFKAFRDAANTTVYFEWEPVDGATGYVVYKAPYNEATEAITGDWAVVATSTPQEYDGKIVASETAAVGLETAYYYTVIATGANNERSLAADVATVDMAVITATDLELAFREPYDARTIQLTWERIPHDAGVTYELHRATVEFGGTGVFSSSNTTPVKYGEWTNISPTADKFTQTKGVVVDTPAINNVPTINTYYIYRLVVKKGNLASEPSYELLAERGAYIKANPYILTQDYDPDNPHGVVALKVSSSIYPYTHGATSIELWRRKYEGGNPQEPYTLVNLAPAQAPFTGTDANDQYWLDRDPTIAIGTQYQYRIVAKYAIGNTTYTFVDLEEDNDDVEIEAYPNEAQITSVPKTVTGTTVTFRFGGSYLAEAPITIRFSDDQYELGGSKTVNGATIIQTPQLGDRDGPSYTTPTYTTNFVANATTGLSLDTYYYVDIGYGENSHYYGYGNDFETAALRLTANQNYYSGNITLTLTSNSDSSSYDPINWSDYINTSMVFERRTTTSPGVWSTTWTTIPDVFSARTFWNYHDDDPATSGSSSQTYIDTVPSYGNEYQYRVRVTGSSVEFRNTLTASVEIP